MQRPLLLLLFVLVPVLFSCKKAIEKKKENIVIEAMTNGRWFVQDYRAIGNNVTPEFTGYEFQFYSDGKVDGILNTSVTSGNWVGDVNQLTITANFPGAGLPLSRLNGLWKITDNSYTYVSAYSVNGADTNYLKLQKK